jgi:hypothetical protein
MPAAGVGVGAPFTRRATARARADERLHPIATASAIAGQAPCSRGSPPACPHAHPRTSGATLPTSGSRALPSVVRRSCPRAFASMARARW